MTSTPVHGIGGVADIPPPFPRHLPRPSRRAVRRRGLQAARSVARHFGPVAWHEARRRTGGRPTEGPPTWAAPLRTVFQDLGATFLKFGQVLGSSPSVFGEDVAAEFRACLDSGPPVPFEDLRVIVEAELGCPLEEHFEFFDRQPIGCASIAVVHRARDRAGRDLAVKILRPEIEKVVPVDLAVLRPLVEFLAKQVGPAAGQILQIVDGFHTQLAEELDLRNEARAMSHYRAMLDAVHLPLVTVPEPYPDLSGMRVLTMEFLDGVPVDDADAVAALGVDPKPLVQQVTQAFLITAIRFGTFHGDVHSGNLMVLRDGRIAALDWGIVGRLDPETHRFFRAVVGAAVGREECWADIVAFLERQYGPALREGLGLEGDALHAYVRAMAEPVLTQPFGQVSIGDLVLAPQRRAAEHQGFEPGRIDPRELWRRWRTHRRLHDQLDAHETFSAEKDRGTFLLGKQLLYFERYGRMYLPDVSIFEDRDFFEALLAAPGSASPAPGVDAPAGGAYRPS